MWLTKDVEVHRDQKEHFLPFKRELKPLEEFEDLETALKSGKLEEINSVASFQSQQEQFGVTVTVTVTVVFGLLGTTIRR